MSKSRAADPSCFVSRFKLHLASKEELARSGQRAPPLPPGKTAMDVISDFLRLISTHAMDHVRQQIGAHLTESDVQWCVTVPAMWTDKGKQSMAEAAQLAGMIKGPLNRSGKGSPHELIIVLEPEAAALYGHLELKENFPLYAA